VSGGEINFDKIRGFISEEDEARYATKYRPQLHDIYMVKSGATTGTTAIVDGRTDFNIWSPLAAIRCDQSVALPYFVLQFLRSKNFQEGVALSWSFGTQQNIGMGVLGNLPVLIPPISEQRDIVGYLSEQSKLLDALQEAAESSIPLLRERRSALISAAVTGKIDVRNAAPAKELAA
jgi:type I restriction enzyme S subunit